MPIFNIETEARYTMKYLVEADTFEEAFKAVQEGIDDYYQEFKGDLLVNASVVSEEEAVYEIRKESGLYSTWSDEKLLEVFKHVH